MNYWERWIGAWKKKTASMSVEEKGAYGELLDWYYANECALPGDQEACYRIAGVRTESEAKACDRVLKLAFVKDERGYTNKRADEEIAKRHAYVARQSEAGRKRWSQPDKDGVIHAKGNGAWWKTREGVLDMGQKLQLPPRTGEEMAAYKDRLFEAIKAERQPAAGASGKFDD